MIGTAGALVRGCGLALVLTTGLVPGGPAQAQALAQTLSGQDLCTAVWDRLTAEAQVLGPLTGRIVAMDQDWCVVAKPVLDMPGQYVPDWHADSLRFRGSALGWLLDGTTVPDRLEVALDGLALVVQTGDARMDYLMAAQARANPIRAELAIGWDAASRSLAVERLLVDFTGANGVEFSATVAGVDLSSTGAMQMSVTSFAVTQADLTVQSHGLFEWYMLMALGPQLLPSDGDMEAAVTGLKAQALAGIDALPESSFSAPSKAALRALMAELPNPAGRLALSMRSEAGFGPARLMGYAMTGVPATLAEAAPILNGVTIDIGWTHEDAP